MLLELGEHLNNEQCPILVSLETGFKYANVGLLDAEDVKL